MATHPRVQKMVLPISPVEPLISRSKQSLKMYSRNHLLVVVSLEIERSVGLTAEAAFEAEGRIQGDSPCP